VTCRADAVNLQQGDRTLTIPVGTITSVEPIEAQRYHRHERRYAATHPFIGRLHDTVLLVRRTEAGPVVIALPPDEQTALHEQLMTVRARQAAHERAAA
jgi:hypothetical protein